MTGGAGFLGSLLCERLLADGHDVLCLENIYTGTKNNIAHPLDNPNFEVVRHDVTFPLYVKVDEIYNLAREMISWEPAIVLRDGLVRTIAYFEQLLRLEPFTKRLFEV